MLNLEYDGGRREEEGSRAWGSKAAWQEVHNFGGLGRLGGRKKQRGEEGPGRLQKKSLGVGVAKLGVRVGVGMSRVRWSGIQLGDCRPLQGLFLY